MFAAAVAKSETVWTELPVSASRSQVPSISLKANDFPALVTTTWKTVLFLIIYAPAKLALSVFFKLA
jgi:hypothetical protein